MSTWRDRNKCRSVRSMSTQLDTVVGEQLLYLDDSKTVPIGCDYLERYVRRWCTFGGGGLWTLIRSTPLSSDIVQGVLGNCWFMSALALVVERADLLEQVLPPESVAQFERCAVACVRLFRGGRWHSVYVDNRLPCNANGELVFSQSKRQQLFVPLIEKAMAKLCGGYSRLMGGHTSQGMTSLTGFPCEVMWLPWMMRTASQPPVDHHHHQQMEECWIKILSYQSAGFLLGVSCGRGDSGAGRWCPITITDSMYANVGLLKNHAYSVLDVVSMDDVRLIKLRNPWGSLVWNGDWSDGSECWTEQLRRQLVPEGCEEGIFWISFVDLCRYFEQMIVCKIRPSWHQYGYEGRFVSSCVDNSDHWTVYELCLADSEHRSNSGCGSMAELSVTLYQKMVDGEEPVLCCIFMVIYELLDSNSSMVIGSYVCSSVCNVQRSVTCECELEGGRRYVLGVYGFGQQWSGESTDINSVDHDEDSGGGCCSCYVLRINASKALKVHCYEANQSLMGEMLVEYARSRGEKYVKGNVVSYQLNRDWAGLLSVVENDDQNCWLQVSMEARLKWNTGHESGNDTNNEWLNYSSVRHNEMIARDGNEYRWSMMCDDKAKTQSEEPDCLDVADSECLFSSRGCLRTEDCIPPKHCQLINVITNRKQQHHHQQQQQQQQNGLVNHNSNKHISLKMNFRMCSLMELVNSHTKQYQRMTAQMLLCSPYHSPPIVDRYGLHCPRFVG